MIPRAVLKNLGKTYMQAATFKKWEKKQAAWLIFWLQSFGFSKPSFQKEHFDSSGGALKPKTTNMSSRLLSARFFLSQKFRRSCFSTFNAFQESSHIYIYTSPCLKSIAIRYDHLTFQTFQATKLRKWSDIRCISPCKSFKRCCHRSDVSMLHGRKQRWSKASTKLRLRGVRFFFHRAGGYGASEKKRLAGICSTPEEVLEFSWCLRETMTDHNKIFQIWKILSNHV